MQIAHRSLNLRTKNGVVDIPIRVFSPDMNVNGAWTCRYEIDWPEGRWIMDAGGVDAVQAIVMAFYMIGSDIYTSNYHKSGQLFFEAPGGGYGFPVPVSLRDLLEGDDKTFF